MKRFFILTYLLFFFQASLAHAEDTFHPEARETLESGKPWVETVFKKSKTKATVNFRAWYPFPAHRVWEVLTDTNNYKTAYADYSDSRTLDINQFNLVKQKKPPTVPSKKMIWMWRDKKSSTRPLIPQRRM